KGTPLNVITAANLLENIGRESPRSLSGLREGVQRDLVEICGGPYVERDDALLPLESQYWNLRKGLAAYQELLGQTVRVFARRRCAFHPQTPLLLKSVGLRLAVLLAFDDSTLPNYQTSVVSMSAPDGGQVDAFCRTPYPAEDPQTYLHWAHYLHKTIAQDQTATLVLLHRCSES